MEEKAGQLGARNLASRNEVLSKERQVRMRNNKIKRWISSILYRTKPDNKTIKMAWTCSEDGIPR